MITSANPQHAAQQKEQQFIHHVLLVEDSPVQALKLKVVLEAEGLEVNIVDDGPEAIEEAHSNDYDLIVLDIELKTLNGYDTCRRLKLNPGTANIPVIIFSHRDRPIDTLAGLELGAIDYIPKDTFAEATLVNTIRFINSGVREFQKNNAPKTIRTP